MKTNLAELAQINVFPLAAITATGGQTGVSLIGVATANPSAALNYEGDIVFLLHALNTAGTTPTLALKLQHADTDSDGEYADITGGGYTGLTTTNVNGIQKVTLQRANLKKFVRLHATIGGTDNPSYYVSLQALVGKKYPA